MDCVVNEIYLEKAVIKKKGQDSLRISQQAGVGAAPRTWSLDSKLSAPSTGSKCLRNLTMKTSKPNAMSMWVSTQHPGFSEELLSFCMWRCLLLSVCAYRIVVSHSVCLCTSESKLINLCIVSCFCLDTSAHWLGSGCLHCRHMWAGPCLTMSVHVRLWDFTEVCVHVLMRASVSACVMCLRGSPWIS